MARTASIKFATGLASLVVLGSLSSASAQSSPPGPAQPSAPQSAPTQPRPSAPAQPNRALNANRPVQAPAARPQSAPPQTARAPQQVPPQAAQAQFQQPDAPPAAGGYNNSGGLIDSTALQTEATQGVHYHYHYYGAGAVVSNPGYGQAGYVNPATAELPNNPYLTPIYGPGNPAPMNTLAGAGNDNFNTRVGGGVGGAVAAAQVGGQAWSYGGGIGHWNPYAYGGNGYVEGFND